MTHAPRVAILRSAFAAQFFATCACGWSGPARANTHAARHDAQHHDFHNQKRPTVDVRRARNPSGGSDEHHGE